MRVHQQSAYVLLNRSYSETSWIVEVFTKDYGRMALMAKGARRIKSQLKGVLLPFQPILVSWTGKGEMPTLTAAEIQPSQLNLIEQELRGDQLVCGFYCNELTMYLLHRYDPHPRLFDRYHTTILGLYDPDSVANETCLANTIRAFEQIMIKEIGYEVNFEFEADGKSPIRPTAYYQFQVGQGFVASSAAARNAIEGRIVLALQSENIEFSKDLDRSQRKLLMRNILSQTLGYKKINSRELFFPKSR